MKKIIGIVINGIVFSIGIATLIKYLIQWYNDYIMNLFYAHVSFEKNRLNTNWLDEPYEKMFHLYDNNAISAFFLFLGIVITIIIIQRRIGISSVYRNMIFSLVIALIVGIVLGFYNASVEIIGFATRERTMAKMWHFTKEPYLKNCFYIGLGIAFLLLGLHLSTEKSKKS